MKRVAIVGAGIVGTTLAWHLVKAGHRVDIFETGPDIPYPHAPQFANEVLHANQFAPPARRIPAPVPDGVRGLVQTGDYRFRLDEERSMCVGGQASRWWGITPRLVPSTFRDWPISYADLEPYYAEAERFLGVSGSASDNPFAAPRSQPYPLPPFELGAADLEFASRLKAQGLVTHTTAQARTRVAYDGRPGCSNYGTCHTCPTGARYSPNHHIAQLLRTGMVTLHTRALVRRVIVERGRARALLYHPEHGAQPKEHAADVVIVAAGGIESARLLLLSSSSGAHRDGLGNDSGQVGRNLVFHHVWRGNMEFVPRTMPGRAGPPTLLSHQFVESASPQQHGGMTVELFDTVYSAAMDDIMRRMWRSGAQVVEAMRPITQTRSITFNAEVRKGPGKYAALAKTSADRFGDPFIHVHYELDDFDRATHAAAVALARRFAGAMGAHSATLEEPGAYWSAHHHLGTCRMGTSARDSVVDSYGAVHDAAGAYVCGGSTFVSGGALQPTLTMVALGIRSARRIAETLL